jgi:tetratricopeptide (TPR) repeat protein
VQGGDSGSGPVVSIIIVSGSVQKVSADDDSTLPPDLRIAVDCHGDSSDGGGASPSGQFRFTLKPNIQALNANSLCSVEAKAFGYDSGMLRFPVRSSTGLINIGALTIQRNASGEAQDRNKEHGASTVSATSLKAPPNAVKLFEQGMHSLQQTKFANAAKDFEAAIQIYPNYAESWLNLGRARLGMSSPDSAREAFFRAAQLDPQLAEPPEELGLLAAGQNDLVSAARYLDDSLRLDPGNSFRACYSDAVVNLMLKRYDIAERSARAALRFGESGNQARANYVLGMALLATGDNAEAKQHLLRYLELSPKAPEREQIQKELNRLDRIEAAK